VGTRVQRGRCCITGDQRHAARPHCASCTPAALLQALVCACNRAYAAKYEHAVPPIDTGCGQPCNRAAMWCGCHGEVVQPARRGARLSQSCCKLQPLRYPAAQALLHDTNMSAGLLCNSGRAGGVVIRPRTFAKQEPPSASDLPPAKATCAAPPHCTHGPPVVAASMSHVSQLAQSQARQLVPTYPACCP
jgi:hypothetical protein